MLVEEADYLLALYRWIVLTGEVPRAQDWLRREEWPRPDYVIDVFGSWERFLGAAEIAELAAAGASARRRGGPAHHRRPRGAARARARARGGPPAPDGDGATAPGGGRGRARRARRPRRAARLPARAGRGARRRRRSAPRRAPAGDGGGRPGRPAAGRLGAVARGPRGARGRARGPFARTRRGAAVRARGAARGRCPRRPHVRGSPSARRGGRRARAVAGGDREEPPADGRGAAGAPPRGPGTCATRRRRPLRPPIAVPPAARRPRRARAPRPARPALRRSRGLRVIARPAATGLGLTGASVSEAARSRKPHLVRGHARRRAPELGPHVALGSGSGAGFIARIYLHFADGSGRSPAKGPTSATSRRHLPDTDRRRRAAAQRRLRRAPGQRTAHAARAPRSRWQRCASR